MIRPVLRNVLLNAFSLYVTTLLFPGLVIHGGLLSLIAGGFLLAIGFKILKPIISIVALPLNIVSLGLFSVVIVAFILFIITLLYPNIEVAGFYFKGFGVGTFEIHPFQVSLLLSYFIISVTIYLIDKMITWLFT